MQAPASTATPALAGAPAPAGDSAAHGEGAQNASSAKPDPLLDQGSKLFMSSIAAHASQQALTAARAAVVTPGLPEERALGFDLSVTLEEGATFRLIRERLPKLKTHDSHLLLPFRVPTPKPARAAHRSTAPTFVVDYDSPRFAPFAQVFDAKLGRSTDMLAMEKLVSEYISNKSFARGFDIASDVASSHTGDCTEHSVLLAAALRRRGIPAKVTFGVLAVLGRELAAFGHAWVEAEQGGEIVRLDAALRGLEQSDNLRIHYLPLAQLSDEGPGFSAAEMREPGLIHVQEVTLTLTAGK